MAVRAAGVGLCSCLHRRFPTHTHSHKTREQKERSGRLYNTAAWAKVPNNSFYFQQHTSVVCLSHEPEAADSSSAIVQSNLNSRPGARSLAHTHMLLLPFLKKPATPAKESGYTNWKIYWPELTFKLIRRTRGIFPRNDWDTLGLSSNWVYLLLYSKFKECFSI